MNGFLSIDKPAGMTSHDVVARVRRLARIKRVGHAGTLDPAATGVLVVALGEATRLIEYVQEETEKRYHAVVRLGITTATEDAEGDVTAELPVPTLDERALRETVARFVGPIMQVPPIYSALHHQGRRLHELAREGVSVELAPRPVTIHAIELLGYDAPLLTLDVRCGKGTYIRSLARDIGAAIGCGAHLAALRRTAVGQFMLADAVALAALEAEPSHGLLSRALLPSTAAVADWPTLTLDAAAEQRVRNGMPLRSDAAADARVRAERGDGTLVALLRSDGAALHPFKVFAAPPAE